MTKKSNLHNVEWYDSVCFFANSVHDARHSDGNEKQLMQEIAEEANRLGAPSLEKNEYPTCKGILDAIDKTVKSQGSEFAAEVEMVVQYLDGEFGR